MNDRSTDPSIDGLLVERARLLDRGRPEAVAKQADRGRLTARARIDLLADPGSFAEYGLLTRPAHADVEGPADGVVTGAVRIDNRYACVVAFDYTVFGGTMGQIGKIKVDRMIALARAHRRPLVLLVEGGGARAQDLGISSREGTTMFVELARLSGQVPMLAGVFGPAFAGHANLVAFCDVIVATRDSSMGIGGPPMVEAATGVRMRPEEIGPVELHAGCGAVDVVANDDANALAVLRELLDLLSGDRPNGPAPQFPERIRDVVPENPRLAYDVRSVIDCLADDETVIELRPEFGRSVVTSLARLDGIAVGVVASQPRHQAGAIDAAASDKIARFIHVCDAHGLALVFLVDTPGFLVGPEAEASALVRHSARVVHALAHVSVPVLTVVMRKAYGLAYYALGAPPFDPLLILEWPTAEYGGMGLGGAAQILHRQEVEGAERAQDAREALSAGLRKDHTSWVAARRFAVDDLIDPAETRGRLITALRSIPPDQRAGSRATIDPW